MNLHKISTTAFEMLKLGMFIVIAMLHVVILYYNLHQTTEKFLYALPVARLMLEECLSVLIIVIIAAFVFDAVQKDRNQG